MSAHRQLACLMLLQHDRKQTAAQLATRLEVSVRTVYRDVEALSGAGVPIRMERGGGGGVVLADDYRRALAQFTSDDIAALVTNSAMPLHELGLADASGALRKLTASLDDRQRAAATRARESLLVDHNRWYRPEPPTGELAVLRAAIETRTLVSMRYRDRAGAATQRVVAPLGLVSKAGAWYLVAREDGKGERTFRADRIEGAVATRTPFVRPPDFDLAAHWRASLASVERPAGNDAYAFVLRLRPDVVDRAVGIWGATVLDAQPAGVTARFSMRSESGAAAVVVAIGDGALIVEPPTLRAAVLACARAALERHADAPEPPAT